MESENGIKKIMRNKLVTIEYKETKDFTEKALERLFLSVDWESGRFPTKLVKAMHNSSHVISAWDGDKLVGLARSIDDGETVALIHYVLVDTEYQGYHIGDTLMKKLMACFESLLYVQVMPSELKNVRFYERYGFKVYDHYTAMVLKQF